jgi:hypothetical protein
MKQRQQQRKKQNLPGFFSCEGVAEWTKCNSSSRHDDSIAQVYLIPLRAAHLSRPKRICRTWAVLFKEKLEPG